MIDEGRESESSVQIFQSILLSITLSFRPSIFYFISHSPEYYYNQGFIPVSFHPSQRSSQHFIYHHPILPSIVLVREKMGEGEEDMEQDV